MYSISLSIRTDNADQRVAAFILVSEAASRLEGEFPSVVVSSHELEGIASEVAEEYYDEYTLLKVVHALREAGIPDDQADAAINQMQNRGILFRERISSGQ